MSSTTSTVSGLVGQFQLRRRASTEDFAAGVQLAQRGAVTLDVVTPDRVTAQVVESEPLAVEIRAVGDWLEGSCPCPAGESTVCRHQVAAAHVLWMHIRRGADV
jgi:uncharacterized Zn finger protein